MPYRGGAFPTADIRVIEIDGAAWFSAKGVCDFLGLRSPSKAVKAHCDAEDYRTIRASEVSASNVISNPLSFSNVGSPNISFPNRGMICENETGIYDLIGASRKPAALEFHDW